jgi:hypothetical protein
VVVLLAVLGLVAEVAGLGLIPAAALADLRFLYESAVAAGDDRAAAEAADTMAAALRRRGDERGRAEWRRLGEAHRRRIGR